MVFPRLGVLVSARRLRIACFGAIAVVSVAFGGCSSEETQPIDDGTVSGNRRPPNNNGRTDDPFDDTGTSGTNVGSSSNGSSGENGSGGSGSGSGENGSGGSGGGGSNGGNPNGKAYGEPCEEDADCQSDLCNQMKFTSDGNRCSRKCETNADCDGPFNYCQMATDPHNEPREDHDYFTCRQPE